MSDSQSDYTLSDAAIWAIGGAFMLIVGILGVVSVFRDLEEKSRSRERAAKALEVVKSQVNNITSQPINPPPSIIQGETSWDVITKIYAPYIEFDRSIIIVVSDEEMKILMKKLPSRVRNADGKTSITIMGKDETKP